MDTRRHAPVGRRRVRLQPLQSQRIRPHAYLGRASRRPLDDIYTSDHADNRQGGRFRWLLSTCLAAGVGVLAILVVIAGATDQSGGEGGLLPPVPQFRDGSLTGLRFPSARIDGLRWAVPKTDRLVIPSGAVATISKIPDSVRVRRDKRDYIMAKHYARVAARLAPVSKREAAAVPAFNPLALYANTTPLGSTDASEEGRQDAVVKIVDLPDGMIPAVDGQELTAREVADLVARTLSAEQEAAALRPGLGGDNADLLAERFRNAPEQTPPNTSLLAKTTFESDDAADDVEGREVRVVKVQRGDTIARIMQKQGAESWQLRNITEAVRQVFPDGNLVAGQEVHVTLVPSLTRPGKSEPVRFSIFGEGQDHKISVMRNATGDFVATDQPFDDRILREAGNDDGQPSASSLYASLYYTAMKQGIPDDVILEVFKIHAYETNFRERVRPGDAFELFFDLKDEDKSGDGTYGDLLAASITSSGATRRFYRFRTPEGQIDYYDEQGNTSRKFLMRRPVRGEDVRITSGFGMRRHPILQGLRMHTGVDWACAMNTPIMAAGSGVIEEAGRKGEYGNYVRIRHANGYKTAYGHMARLAPGVADGVKVQQGQIIGYVGTTGLSSGPHVHFEVLVNNRFVDPNLIQVPRDHQLTGKQLADFQKERTRIDELMRRNPVSTRVSTLGGA